MPTEHTVADNMWEVLLFPIFGILSILPSSVRNYIKSIPLQLVWTIMKIIWTILFWSYISSLIWPYFMKLAVVMDFYTVILEYYVYLLNSGKHYWTTIQMSPLGLFVAGYSMLMVAVRSTIAFVKPKPSRSLLTSALCNALPSALNGYIGERAMKGSELIPAQQLPSFQCFIYRSENKEAKEFLGMGFRVENAILTAFHVLAGYDEFVVVTNNNSQVLSADRARGFPMEDVAFFLLEEREFSILGMSKGTLMDHAVPDDHPIFCQIFGPGTPVSYTMGTVETAKNFGKVVYSGSTGRGFSGAPYVVHKQVVGMHLGAGVLNLGIDAAFLRMLLSTCPEDTEDWLMQELERDILKGRKVDWRHSPGDPEEVFVKRQGKYFTMTAQDFFSTYSPQSYVETLTGVNAKLSPTYDDSKNGLRAPDQPSVVAGANGKMSESESSAHIPAEHPSNQTQMPTLSMVEKISGMTHHAPTPVQLKEVSNYTLKDTSYEPEKRQNRKKRWLKARSARPSEYSHPGSPGLEMIR